MVSIPGSGLFNAMIISLCHHINLFWIRGCIFKHILKSINYKAKWITRSDWLNWIDLSYLERALYQSRASSMFKTSRYPYDGKLEKVICVNTHFLATTSYNADIKGLLLFAAFSTNQRTEIEKIAFLNVVKSGGLYFRLALFRVGRGHNVHPYRFFLCCAKTISSRPMKRSDF